MKGPTGSDFTSAYNEGMLQIERLHYLWTQANNQSRQGRYEEWRWTLDTIWRELSRDAIKKEIEKIQPGEYKKSVEESKWFKEYHELDTAIDKAEMERRKNPKDRVTMRAVYVSLSNFEIFLRALQDSVGKGGKYKEEDDDIMD